MVFRNRLFAVSLALAGLLGCADLNARSDNNAAGEKFEPVRGQSGKDVIWIPTPTGVVNEMLRMAQVKSSDVVYDLGAGDGIIAITAAKEFGARAVGIEYNPQMAQFAQANAQKAGVADKVKIIAGDIFAENFSEASVVTMYLLPALNLKLRPTLLKMKPGTRVVSHAFDMAEWEPDEKSTAAGGSAYLWIVPAQAAGQWELKGVGGPAPARVSIEQSFQRVGGTFTQGGTTQPLLGAQLRGDQLSFQVMGPDKALQTVTATVKGKDLTGTVKAAGDSRMVQGRRV